MNPPVRLLKRAKLARVDFGTTNPGPFRAASNFVPTRTINLSFDRDVFVTHGVIESLPGKQAGPRADWPVAGAP